MAKTDIGQGKQALALGGGGVTGYTNNSNAITYTATSVTPTASPAWTVSTTSNFGSANVWTGFICVAGGSANTVPLVYGVITSNTATALTVDKWYNPASPSGAAATTPGSGAPFIIIPGNAPAWYMAITTAGVALTDTSLASELTTNGLGRAPATFAHTFSSTVAQNTYTLTNTFTYSSTTPVVIHAIGIFDALTNGVPLFTTLLSSDATVNASGDAVTITDTITQ